MSAPLPLSEAQAGHGGEHGPNCWQCRFFGITHQPATPYACQRMGFRSQILPSLEVLRTDGRFCQGFVAKAGAAPAPAAADTRAAPAPLSTSTWSRFA